MILRISRLRGLQSFRLYHFQDSKGVRVPNVAKFQTL